MCYKESTIGNLIAHQRGGRNGDRRYFDYCVVRSRGWVCQTRNRGGAIARFARFGVLMEREEIL